MRAGHLNSSVRQNIEENEIGNTDGNQSNNPTALKLRSNESNGTKTAENTSEMVMESKLSGTTRKLRKYIFLP